MSQSGRLGKKEEKEKEDMIQIDHVWVEQSKQQIHWKYDALFTSSLVIDQ